MNYTGDGYLYIFTRHGYKPTPAVVAEAVKAELERYGFQNVTAQVENIANNGVTTWKVEGMWNGVKYVFTGTGEFTRSTAEIVVNNKISYVWVDGKLTAERLGLANGDYKINQTTVDEKGDEEKRAGYVRVTTVDGKKVVAFYDTDGTARPDLTSFNDFIIAGDVVVFTTVNNFKPAEPTTIQGEVSENLPGVTATFNGIAAGEDISASVGAPVTIEITGAAAAPESRATVTTFEDGKVYTVTINGAEYTSTAAKDNKITVTYTIKSGDTKIEITDIVEKVETVEGAVTVEVKGAGDAGTYTADTKTLTEAGKEYTITITDENYNTGDTYVVSGEGVTGVDNKDGTITVTYTTPAEIPAEGMTLTITVTKTAYVDTGDSEIVKAVMGTPTGPNVTVTEFQAYWAEGETAPDILSSKKLIAKALTDAGYSVTEADIDLENKTVTENSAGMGYVISWSTAAPTVTRLYKVTFNGDANTAVYGKNGADVTLDVPSTVKGILPEDKASDGDAGSDIKKPTLNRCTIRVANADVNYVEAIKVTSTIASGALEDAGSNELLIATIKPIGTGTEAFLVSNTWIQKDYKITLSAGADLAANQKFNLVVNGTATAKTAAADGTFDEEVTVVGDANGEMTITVAATFDVYLDDATTPLTFDANGTIILDGMAGKKLVYLDVSDDSLKDASSAWAAGATSKDGTLTLATLAGLTDAVSATGDIHIYRAYELDMSGVTDYEVYTGYPCVAENKLTLTANKAYVKASGASELYVMAGDANTWLVTAAGAKVVLGTARQDPNQIRKGVWPITLTAALDGDTEIVAGAAFEAVEIDLAAAGLKADNTNEVTVVNFGAENTITIDATKLVWTDGADIGGAKVTVSVDGSDPTKVVLDNAAGTAINQGANKLNVGTLKVVLSDGRTMTYNIVINP